MLTDCVRSACTLPDRIGASIIIYFYVFSLTTYGLETARGCDHMADRTIVYGPYDEF